MQSSLETRHIAIDKMVDLVVVNIVLEKSSSKGVLPVKVAVVSKVTVNYGGTLVGAVEKTKRRTLFSRLPLTEPTIRNEEPPVRSAALSGAQRRSPCLASTWPPSRPLHQRLALPHLPPLLRIFSAPTPKWLDHFLPTTDGGEVKTRRCGRWCERRCGDARFDKRK
jgi:hypothetical protein